MSEKEKRRRVKAGEVAENAGEGVSKV